MKKNLKFQQLRRVGISNCINFISTVITISHIPTSDPHEKTHTQKMHQLTCFWFFFHTDDFVLWWYLYWWRNEFLSENQTSEAFDKEGSNIFNFLNIYIFIYHILLKAISLPQLIQIYDCTLAVIFCIVCTN